MIEGTSLKYMRVAILTTEEYKVRQPMHGKDIVIIDDGKEAIVIKNRFGSFNMEKLKELHGICHWCNEKPSVYIVGTGCDTCPTIPYDCTCDAGDNPHALDCERNPKAPKKWRAFGGLKDLK